MSLDHILVVAVEVGIPYSGCGCSFLHEFENDALQVTISRWFPKNGQSFTIPTALLLNQKKNFVAFGSKAVEAYEALVEDGKEKEYYYMDLCSSPLDISKLTIKSTLTDVTGKEILIKDVFTHGIAFMTKHVSSYLNRYAHMSIEEVKWVFIAPFGREDDMTFMRDAAVKAGIAPVHCLVATRQEALMFYHMYHRRKEYVGSIRRYIPDNHYILVDVGKYNVEITLMEIQVNGKMKQITNINGAFGETEFFFSFEKCLGRELGEGFIEKYKKENVSDFNCFMDDFLNKSFWKSKTYGTKMMAFKMPISLKEECSDSFGEELMDIIARSDYRDTWCVVGDKIRMPFSTIKPLLDELLQKIKLLVRKIIESEQTIEVHTILMNGRLFWMPTVQEHFKKSFPGMRIITPEENTDAMNHIVGGVVLGHNNGILPKSDCMLDVGIETYADIDFVPNHA